MLIEDLIGSSLGLGIREVQMIKAECSQFINETGGLPLLKSLPLTYTNFHKVKVRLQKRRDSVTDIFERAFGADFSNLRQRAVFAYPLAPTLIEQNDTFYVFPVNGYKYLYSKEVTNSSSDYRRVVDTLFEQFDDETQASEVVADLLKYTYTSTNLREGIEAEAEIILYGIPYYYAVRVSACQDYRSLLTMAK
jgi:hypothetical protein